MGDANPIRTLGDYSKPIQEGYKNIIELPIRNNVVPLRSDTIRLVQNGCSFHGLRSEDPNQHLKDFLKLMDSLDLDGLQQVSGIDMVSSRFAVFRVCPETLKIIWRLKKMNFIVAACFGMLQQVVDIKICSGPHDTQYCMENPKEAFVEYASSHSDKAGDARLSKFEVDFKQQQSKMTNKIDTILKAITDRMAGALPIDTPEKGERNGEGNPKNTNAIEEQRDTPQPELKNPTVIDKIRPSRNNKEIEWLDIKEQWIQITFKTPYKDLKRSKLSSEGHDLLSSRIILSEDDYDRGCRKPSDLEDGFYKDTSKLGPECVTGMDDEGEVT
ncbi:hypothetical protein Tco_0777704 [Tanacetum coccineum]